MGHAYHDDVNPEEYKKFTKQLDDDWWDSKEEKRTIKEIESPAAKELGEDTRNWHNSRRTIYNRPYNSTSSTSI